MNQAIHSGHRPFDEAAQLVRESRSFGVIRRLAEIAGRLIKESRLVAVTRSRASEFTRLAVHARLRIIGVLVLCAAITNAALLVFVSPQMAPAPPFMMPILAGLAGVLLILASSW